MIIVDAHIDLAWNMLSFGRDYTLSAGEIRRREKGTLIPDHNGEALVGWPDFQRGQVAIVFSTLFASPIRRQAAAWDHQVYSTTTQARSMYRAQLDTYYRLVEEHPDKFRLVTVQGDLCKVLDHWKDPAQSAHPVGLVPLMEGAEAIEDPGELEEWWRRGLRLIGPAWVGTRFCGGSGEPGPLTPDGYALLEGMAAFGFVLDISHMDERAALQALDFYPGAVIASHSNALALLKGVDSNRHLSDAVIRALLERNGIIGIVPIGSFLLPGWKAGDPRELVGLERVAAQIDYICQMAGDAWHVGLGTDFDGGFGVQSAPPELDSSADLPKIGALLAERGYAETDIAAILGENWISLLRRALPD